jgi:glutathione S-transferase
MTPPGLREIHPLGKSPVISDDCRVMAESDAIIDYLIRRHCDDGFERDRSSNAYDGYVHWLYCAEGPAEAISFSLPQTRMEGCPGVCVAAWRPSLTRSSAI